MDNRRPRMSLFITFCPLLPVFFHQPGYFVEPADNAPKVFLFVGERAGAAVFQALLCVSEAAAAFIVQRVHGAVTKKAVEIFRVFRLVAGEPFATLVPYEGICLAAPIRLHLSPPFAPIINPPVKVYLVNSNRGINKYAFACVSRHADQKRFGGFPCREDCKNRIHGSLPPPRFINPDRASGP